MSAITGMAFSFAWPLALGAIPLALGALVYLFRARGTTQSRITSSLFLLTQLPQYLPSRRRFMPPMQFWLELALVFALALAASGISPVRTGTRVAVVVDTSKSMGARMSVEETRLQAALRIAAADIARAPSDTLFTVLRATRTLSSGAGSSGRHSNLDKHAAISALKAVQASYEEDSLASLIGDLRAQREYDSIWLYTDRTIEGGGADSSFRATSVPYDPDTARNIWISSIQLRSANDLGQKAERSSLIEVGVSRVGSGEDQVAVSATCTDRQSGTVITLHSATQRLVAQASSLINLGPISAPWSFCHVLVSGEEDLLLQDNYAWIAHPRDRGEFGVVSALSPQALGLDRIPFSSAVAVSASDAAESGLRGILYHRTAPTKLPSIPALVVYPQTGAKLWGGLVKGDAARGPGGAVEITRWDESHQILQYVRPGLLALPTARVLECPDAARPILHSAAGAVMCVGEEGGKRYVIVGFELFPFDGMRNPTLSIVTLNILQWLQSSLAGTAAQAGAAGLINSTGLIDLSAIGRGLDLRVQIIAPHKEELASDKTESVEVREPGVLAVSDLKSNLSSEQLIAVNALSDQESDLRHTAPILITSDEIGLQSNANRGVGSEPGIINRVARESDNKLVSEDATESKGVYERILIWSALVIVALDLLRRIIGRHGWREPA